MDHHEDVAVCARQFAHDGIEQEGHVAIGDGKDGAGDALGRNGFDICDCHACALAIPIGNFGGGMRASCQQHLTVIGLDVIRTGTAVEESRIDHWRLGRLRGLACRLQNLVAFGVAAACHKTSSR